MLPLNIPSNMKQAKGRRNYRKYAAKSCSACAKQHFRAGQRYCVDCHNAYMRKWRKTHPLTEAQKVKDRCRSIASVYKKRGKLVKAPCEKCGSSRSQMHHEDYSKPLEVEWLCRPCHMAHHKQLLVDAKRKKFAEIAARVNRKQAA